MTKLILLKWSSWNHSGRWDKRNFKFALIHENIVSKLQWIHHLKLQVLLTLFEGNTIRKVGRNLFNWYWNQPHQKVNMRFPLKRCSTETLKPRQRFCDKRIEVFCLILIHSILKYSISNHFLNEWNASCGTFCLSLSMKLNPYK